MKINSKNKKILIFSDVHQDSERAQKIIKHEGADINICLGDWFDSDVYDSEYELEKTVIFLRKFLAGKNNYTLFGNHDTSYLYDKSRYTKCSGYEDRKLEHIKKTLGEKFYPIRDKFKWHLIVDNFLLTHAGLHESYIPYSMDMNLNKIDLWLEKEGELAHQNLITGQNHWFCNVGSARWGSARFGGITWLDWTLEFDHIKGLYQIVGHTHNEKIRVSVNGSVDLLKSDFCIDSQLCEWLTITNGKLEIKKYRDL